MQIFPIRSPILLLNCWQALQRVKTRRESCCGQAVLLARRHRARCRFRKKVYWELATMTVVNRIIRFSFLITSILLSCIVLLQVRVREPVAKVSCANKTVVSVYVRGLFDGGVVEVEVQKDGRKVIEHRVVGATWKSRFQTDFVVYRSPGDEVIGVAEVGLCNHLLFLLAPESLESWPGNGNDDSASQYSIDKKPGRELLNRLRSECSYPLRDSLVLAHE